MVFDLYSGTGTIAQILAPVAKKVVGVEIVEEAVRSAQVNARLNGLENCEFLAGDVLKVIDELQDKPDLIVVDPPRDGIHPKALGKIIDFEWTGLYIYPVNQPVWSGIWWCCRIEGIGWRKFVGWICFRGQGMSRW